MHFFGQQSYIHRSGLEFYIDLVWIFTIPIGMNKLSFCIFRRIYVRLPVACQVA